MCLHDGEDGEHRGVDFVERSEISVTADAIVFGWKPPDCVYMSLQKKGSTVYHIRLNPSTDAQPLTIKMLHLGIHSIPNRDKIVCLA